MGRFAWDVDADPPRLLDAVRLLAPVLAGDPRTRAERLRALRDHVRSDRRRHRCDACDGPLVLSLPAEEATLASYRPRFSHGGGRDDAPTGCPLGDRADGESEAHLSGKAALRDWLRRAHPDSHPVLERRRARPGGAYRPDLLAWPGGRSVAVEFKRSGLGEEEARRRRQRRRDDVGSGRLHLRVFDHRAGAQWRYAAGNQGRAPGAPRLVVPTAAQRALVASGAAVLWLDVEAAWAWLPYSVRRRPLEARPGER